MKQKFVYCENCRTKIKLNAINCSKCKTKNRYFTFNDCIYCKYCGQPIYENTHFCKYCGKNLFLDFKNNITSLKVLSIITFILIILVEIFLIIDFFNQFNIKEDIILIFYPSTSLTIIIFSFFAILFFKFKKKFQENILILLSGFYAFRSFTELIRSNNLLFSIILFIIFSLLITIIILISKIQKNSTDFFIYFEDKIGVQLGISLGSISPLLIYKIFNEFDFSTLYSFLNTPDFYYKIISYIIIIAILISTYINYNFLFYLTFGYYFYFYLRSIIMLIDNGVYNYLNYSHTVFGKISFFGLSIAAVYVVIIFLITFAKMIKND